MRSVKVHRSPTNVDGLQTVEPAGRSGRFLRRIATRVAVASLSVLTACAAIQPSAPPPGENLSGRLAVRIDAADGAAARTVNASFELQGDSQTGRLNLASPLGSILAQARWAPGTVVLATPQGETRFADMDALTREVLGESLPVAALFDWLRGRPWQGAASRQNASAADAGFEQLGWVVSLAHFDEARIDARRERAPVVILHAKIDRP